MSRKISIKTKPLPTKVGSGLVRHGRIEHRELEVLGNWGIQWPGLRHIIRLTRLRIFPKTGKLERKVSYYLTSIPPSQASPEQLQKLIRDHWGIENLLHRNRDTLMKEDASTVRTGSTPQTLAACRNAALNKLKNINKSPTIATEITAHKPHNAINQCIKR